MGLRRSSAGMGRTKKRSEKKKSPLKFSSTPTVISQDMFFEEWMEESKLKKNGLCTIEEEEKEEAANDGAETTNCEVETEPTNKQLEGYYVALKHWEEYLCLPGTGTKDVLLSRKTIFKEAMAFYKSTCQRSYAVCGTVYKVPCVIQIVGVLACAEFQRLSLNPEVSSWIYNLSDLDSTLCLLVNTLAQESGCVVRCWWNAADQCFVLFCPITTISATGVQMNEETPTKDIGMSTGEGEVKEAQPAKLVVKPIPVRPCTQFLPQENHKD